MQKKPFGLFVFMGGKIVYSAMTTPKEEKDAKITAPILLLLSVATNIDVLALGLSLFFPLIFLKLRL